MKVKLINENFKENYLSNLLHARGIKDIEQYLNPTEDCLNSPSLLNNIEKGYSLLKQILNKENSNILIVVDCDVDGFTSAAIIWLYIKKIAPNQRLSFILHEHKEHGLQDHMDTFDSDDFYDLVILPDSSSNDYEYHEVLGSIGTKCLVLDHHDIEPNTKISEHVTIINNQLSPNYPNKELTGAGVTWQFCRYYDLQESTCYSDDLIDLAALGICGDMGSILNIENRYIMKKGFNNIKNYLFKQAVIKQSYSMGNAITPISVAFYIVPMMNAMIRIGTMEEKERLFLGFIDGHKQVECNKRGAKGTTEEVAIESLRECTNAKAKQNRITDQMVDKLEQKIYKHDLLSNKILFVRLEDDDDFPSEINGLIAMKLAAKFKRPTIVARLNNEGYDKGSIRNVSNCMLEDLKQFLNDSAYFEWVQGHANAAGACILDSKLKEFHNYANEALQDLDFNENAYDVNFIRTGNDTDIEEMVYELAGNSEIWGQGNPEPMICVKDILISDFIIMGAKKDTLKFEKNGVSYIKFHATDMIDELQKCNEIKITIVGKANIDEWMGNQSAQIFIENYEIIDGLLEF